MKDAVLCLMLLAAGCGSATSEVVYSSTGTLHLDSQILRFSGIGAPAVSKGRCTQTLRADIPPEHWYLALYIRAVPPPSGAFGLDSTMPYELFLYYCKGVGDFCNWPYPDDKFVTYTQVGGSLTTDWNAPFLHASADYTAVKGGFKNSKPTPWELHQVRLTIDFDLKGCAEGQ